MSKPRGASDPQYHVQSLHEYVLAPLSTAASRAQSERAEITAERDAFREFRERVVSVEPAAVSTSRCIPEHGGRETGSGLERVRAAYRETVMDVPHYERVYGEPLAEHAAAELGSKLANQLRATSAASFTPPLRDALCVAVQRAVEERERLLGLLDGEASSLKQSRNELSTLLRPLSSTVIPEWHRESFLRDLDAVARRRQETLRSRGDLPDGGDYALTTHLYEDAPWNYPVLSAVARVRETVTVSEAGGGPSASHIRESTSNDVRQ